MLPDSRVPAAELLTRRAQSSLPSRGPSAGRGAGLQGRGAVGGPGASGDGVPSERGRSDARFIKGDECSGLSPFYSFVIFEHFHKELK